MAIIRVRALSCFPEVVREVGGDPDRLLVQVGIDPSDVGRAELFVPLQSAMTVLEEAARLGWRGVVLPCQQFVLKCQDRRGVDRSP